MQRILPVTHEHALFDVAGTRAIEQRAAATLPPHTLMARAGEATARLVLALVPHAQQVWIAAGPGNNGGDGLEAASQLQRWGKQVTVSLIGDPAQLPADAREALASAQAAGVCFDESPPSNPDLAIDTLLGIGASRAPQGAIAATIKQLNALTCPLLAIDIPSGLHADTGQPLGDACVNATHTLTLLTLKPGLFTGSGRDHAGSVWLDDLGVDTSGDAPTAWLSGAQARHARRHAQHKGSFGDVAVIGGAPGMSGAALLAARAAHAAGAGRVFVDLLEAHALTLDFARPELMFRHDWHRSAPEVLARSAIVCGCGGGDAVRVVLPRMLSLAARLVLDADALNALAADASLIPLLRARATRGLSTVLTPHPLEAARLLGSTTAEVQSDRRRAALALAERFDAIAVLKGSGSVIAAPRQVPRINSSGNASLATGGTGDVLAGWLGGRWAALDAHDADAAFAITVQAVAEHGAAAEPASPGALRAGDLIERLLRH